MNAESLPEVALRARHRIAWRLLPFLILLYIVAYIDRVNVGYDEREPARRQAGYDRHGRRT